jgi:hypothetical protein
MEDEGRSGGLGGEIDKGLTSKSKGLKIGLERESIVLS